MTCMPVLCFVISTWAEFQPHPETQKVQIYFDYWNSFRFTSTHKCASERAHTHYIIWFLFFIFLLCFSNKEESAFKKQRIFLVIQIPERVINWKYKSTHARARARERIHTHTHTHTHARTHARTHTHDHNTRTNTCTHKRPCTFTLPASYTSEREREI